MSQLARIVLGEDLPPASVEAGVELRQDAHSQIELDRDGAGGRVLHREPVVDDARSPAVAGSQPHLDPAVRHVALRAHGGRRDVRRGWIEHRRRLDRRVLRSSRPCDEHRTCRERDRESS